MKTIKKCKQEKCKMSATNIFVNSKRKLSALVVV